jgi:uncharacterized circularly permuted ATP-grasp superfamily protein
MALDHYYNEMYDEDARCAALRRRSRMARRDAAARIAQNRHAADLLFHRVGITFAVYGEASGTERLIPFDIVPHVIPATSGTARARPAPARAGAEPLPARHLPRQEILARARSRASR